MAEACEKEIKNSIEENYKYERPKLLMLTDKKRRMKSGRDIGNILKVDKYMCKPADIGDLLLSVWILLHE